VYYHNQVSTNITLSVQIPGNLIATSNGLLAQLIRITQNTKIVFAIIQIILCQQAERLIHLATQIWGKFRLFIFGLNSIAHHVGRNIQGMGGIGYVMDEILLSPIHPMQVLDLQHHRCNHMSK
jgi:hypothetical protein